ncbi:IWS1-like protein [Octopus sinensis]|uniref:IWS1-like protein n=1 Tax=Octopus sinensis TaxID=2607531 RepID=A0A6P7SRL8_9MOLL|nr:IWS1-like protein [Octopus sinensis]
MEIDASGDQSGGSTPVQDEPTYSDVENQDIENSDDEEENHTNSLKNCRAADSDEYISDGGEFVREDVQHELEDEEVEREEVERNSDENISDDNEEDDNNNEDDDNNDADAPNHPGSISSANRSRSVSPAHSRSDRSRSTSPQSPIHSPMSVPKSNSNPSRSPSPVNQHSRSPLDSPSQSRSRSGSPASQRSRSDSAQSQRSDSAASHRSSSWSPSRQNESQSVHRSRSGSVASQRSHSSSHRSASGSPASHHSESRSWRSGSAESQRSLSGSRHSASRSPVSHQSQSGSSVSNRSRSRSRRSQSGSPASQHSGGYMSPQRIDSKSSPSHKSQSSPAGSVKSPLSVSNVQNSQPDSPVAPVASPLPLSHVKNKRENLFTDSENSDSESEQIKRRIQGQIQSDSEDEDEKLRSNINRALSTGLESDDDDDDDGDNKTSHGRTAERVTQKSTKRILSDSEDEPSKAKGSENEDDESDKETGEKLIADIFGSSDEDEEFEGFGEADVEAVPKRKEKKAENEDNDDDDDDDDDDQQKTDLNDDNNEGLPLVSDDENDELVRDSQREDFVSDFDVMLEKKKAERQGNRRRRKDIDIINDNDDLIADMVQKMKVAAEEDRELNQSKKAATKKLKYLPFVYSQLKKTDLHIAFLDCGILSAMTEWLAPLPDRSLPHLSIRENFLRILIEFPPIGTDSLKSSGIGKAVMYLYKHPKETRGNKICAGKLINEWSRPIFNLTSDYSMLSKEDREERDYQQLPKKRRVSDQGGETPRRDIDKALNSEEKALRPGEKGWVYRARVPMPSNKDYVVRPKWNVDENPRKSSKKALTRYEVQMRQFQEKKRRNKTQRAVTISIEGRNMSL